MCLNAPPWGKWVEMKEALHEYRLAIADDEMNAVKERSEAC